MLSLLNSPKTSLIHLVPTFFYLLSTATQLQAHFPQTFKHIVFLLLSKKAHTESCQSQQLLEASIIDILEKLDIIKPVTLVETFGGKNTLFIYVLNNHFINWINIIGWFALGLSDRNEKYVLDLNQFIHSTFKSYLILIILLSYFNS